MLENKKLKRNLEKNIIDIVIVNNEIKCKLLYFLNEFESFLKK